MNYKTFRKKADRVAQDLGLVNVTTKRQEKNGTIIYHDPVASTSVKSVSYGLYSSGMVRRILTFNHRGGNVRLRQMYQLNRTRTVKGKPSAYAAGYYLNIFQFTKRIPANQMEQIGILSNRVLHFREYLVKLDLQEQSWKN